MREQHIAPAVAAAAFAATLTVLLWQRAPSTEAPVPSIAVSTPLQSAAWPSQLPVSADRGSSVRARKETLSPAPAVDAVPAAPDADAVAGPQPTVPDSSALPSYEEDQASRDGEVLRSARTR